MKRKCDVCGKTYLADPRNLRRGWGLTCSKSCGAKKREKSKATYNTSNVKKNNRRRLLWWDDEYRTPYYGERDWYEDEHPFSCEGLGQW